MVAALLCLTRAQSPRRAAAADALSAARQLRSALLQKPVEQRTAADYGRVLELLPPLWQDEHAPAAASARFEAASLYVAEARDLHDRAAYQQAARVLRDLLRLTPYSSYRRNAEFSLVQVDIYHLHDATAARVWLRDFIRRYPADPRIEVARQEERGAKPPEPEFMVATLPLPVLPDAAPPQTALAAAAPVAPPAPAEAANTATARARQWKIHIGNIDGVQVFTNANATSVVLSLLRQVSFTRASWPKRHLVYFDVSSQGVSRRRAASGSARMRVGDGRVVSIRVEQYRKGITRVVLETTAEVKVDRGGFYPNPDRLIIGLTGAAAGGGHRIADPGAETGTPLRGAGSGTADAIPAPLTLATSKRKARFAKNPRADPPSRAVRLWLL
ncbi:MAG: hypothetical protein ACRD1C_05480 [Terriglobales bacterium]